MNKNIKNNCSKCKQNTIWTDYTKKNYCTDHFQEIIEKRIRKHMRINKLINLKNKKSEYYLIKDKENKYLITEIFLKKIFHDRLNIKITKLKKESETTIMNNTLDDEAQELLNYFIKEKKPKTTNKIIKPLSIITDKEIEKIAEIHNIKLKIKPKEHNSLTNKDPQLLFSLHKSKEFLDNRIKK